MKRIPQVDQYIENKPQWSGILSLLREIIASTGLVETVKWGAPTYTLDGKNLVGLGAFKEYAGIWFFQGALLKDPGKVLMNAQEGKTKALRQWRFASNDKIPAEQVKAYIEEAIENQNKGLIIKPSSPTQKSLVIPEELQESFELYPNLQQKFDAMGLTKKREFSEYIASAKRPETRIKRREKVISLIGKGLGLYDKYK